MAPFSNYVEILARSRSFSVSGELTARHIFLYKINVLFSILWISSVCPNSLNKKVQSSNSYVKTSNIFYDDLESFFVSTKFLGTSMATLGLCLC